MQRRVDAERLGGLKVDDESRGPKSLTSWVPAAVPSDFHSWAPIPKNSALLKAVKVAVALSPNPFVFPNQAVGNASNGMTSWSLDGAPSVTQSELSTRL